jgi:hypothetical protein
LLSTVLAWHSLMWHTIYPDMIWYDRCMTMILMMSYYKLK